jgi:hypothetical protein
MNRRKKRETKDLYKYLEVLSNKFKSIKEAKNQRIKVFIFIKSNHENKELMYFF